MTDKFGSTRPLSFTRRNLIHSSLAATILFPCWKRIAPKRPRRFPPVLLWSPHPTARGINYFGPQAQKLISL